MTTDDIDMHEHEWPAAEERRSYHGSLGVRRPVKFWQKAQLFRDGQVVERTILEGSSLPKIERRLMAMKSEGWKRDGGPTTEYV